MTTSFRPLLFTLIAASCAIPTLSIRPAHAVAVDSISLENASFFDSGVVRDDTAQLFEMPQFDNNSNSRPAPLTFKTNRSIAAKAVFSVTPNNVTETVKVRASGNGFKWRQKDCTAQNGNLEYSFEYSDIYTPDKVRKANLVINWEYSTDGGDSWNSAGKSGNVTYVSKGIDGVSVSALHTVLDISCSNADGQSDPSPIFNGIWNRFTTRAVTRQDGAPMTYFGNNSAGSYTGTGSAEDLVRNVNGNCDMWSDLFARTLSLQDVPRVHYLVKPQPVEGVAAGNLFIKMNPAPAQNNPNPLFIFNYHRMIASDATRSRGGLYDPSFGESYETDTPFRDWEERNSVSRIYYTAENEEIEVPKSPEFECEFYDLPF